jgi:integrase/recombinase XerD
VSTFGYTIITVMMLGVTEIEARPIEGRIVPAGADAVVVRLTADWLSTFARATELAYRTDLEHWRAWCEVRGLNVLAARRSDVERWITEQQAEGIAKRTIARRVSVASSWYAFIEEGADGQLCARNPAKTRRRPKTDRDDSPTVGLTRMQAQALIAAADTDGPRSAALIRLLLGNGLRIGTAVGARIENMTEDDGHHVISLIGKGDVRRKVPIPPTVYAAIMRMLAGRGNPAEGPLFVTSTGRAMDRHYAFRLVRRIALRAGISTAGQLSPHSMRHTFATEALRKGVPLHQVQDDMWHADPRTTETYNRARNRLEKNSAYLVAAEFEPVTEETP